MSQLYSTSPLLSQVTLSSPPPLLPSSLSSPPPLLPLLPHPSTIMAAASLLPPPPPVSHASSLSEWLKLLQLEHLEGKLAEYSLQKLTKFWDIELTSVRALHLLVSVTYKSVLVVINILSHLIGPTQVVGIELLGYRKRLQYGIAGLRSAHPEWMHEQQTAYNSLKRVSHFFFFIDACHPLLINFLLRRLRPLPAPHPSTVCPSSKTIGTYAQLRRHDTPEQSSPLPWYWIR